MNIVPEVQLRNSTVCDKHGDGPPHAIRSGRCIREVYSMCITLTSLSTQPHLVSRVYEVLTIRSKGHALGYSQGRLKKQNHQTQGRGQEGLG